MNAGKILLVDDELNILEGYQRQLRRSFTTQTAQSGDQGLQVIRESGPFAVIISDFKMPGMNGIEFLKRAREIAPDTVRMMLTGFAEIQAVIEAINQGNIFRFLTKPCPPEVLISALEDGIRQYQLILGERELLEKTLKGTIQVLTEVLSLVNPEAFGRASRITRYVREIAEQLIDIRPEDRWQLETSAMLSQIGCILLPQEAIKKIYEGKPLTAEENQVFQMHSGIAYDLLKQIPRMESVAKAIYYQEKGFDGSGIPMDDRMGEAIPLGARVLKAVSDFDIWTTRGESQGKALLRLKNASGLYDPLVLKAFEKVLGTEAQFDLQSLSVSELKENMILDQTIWSSDGSKKVLSEGYELTLTLLGQLKKFKDIFGVKEPIRVRVPLER
jgi:response regulator RpfG family c-di-GMP phosphodiesterase